MRTNKHISLALAFCTALMYSEAACAQVDSGGSSTANPSVGVQGSAVPPSATVPGYGDGSGNTQRVDLSHPLPVAGSFSASLNGFASNGSNTNISATTSSTDAALPTGTDVVIYNRGPNGIHYSLTVGAGSSDTTDKFLGSGQAAGEHVGSNTHISVLTDSGTANVNVAGGAGLAPSFGGGDAKEAKQDTANTALAAIQASVAASATAAAQATAQTSLGTIATNSSGIASSSSTIATNTTNIATSNSTIATSTGTIADSAYLGSGSASVIALLKGLYAAIITPAQLAAGTNIAGKFGIDQTLPGSTNGTQDAATGSVGTTAPTKVIGVGVKSNGNIVPSIMADKSVPVNVTTATDTQLVALSAGKAIYVTAYDFIVGGADNVTLEYGTGTNCATGQTALTGPYPFAANGGEARGDGNGPLLFVPAGNALCVKTSAAQQLSGSLAYTQQ